MSISNPIKTPFRHIRDVVRPLINLLPEYGYLGPIVRHKSVRTRWIDGYRFHLNVVDNGIGQALFTKGQREVAFMQLLKQEITPGMVAVDIGANIGYTTVFLCAGVGKEGRVFAFEPDPHNVHLLNKNLKANDFQDLTEVHSAAVSDGDRVDTFYIANQPNVSAMVPGANTVRSITTDVVSLSSFFERRSLLPNFLKMDVEGHEVEVFAGAFDLFKNTNETIKILLEVHPDTYSKEHDFGAQLQRYFDIGFDVKYIISTPVAQPALFKKMGYTPAQSIPTDGRVRGVYTAVSNTDAIELACQPHQEATDTEVSSKIVRSLMLQKN